MATTPKTLKRGIANAEAIAATDSASGPPNALARESPKIAKLLLKTPCRITPLRDASFVDATDRIKPNKNKSDLCQKVNARLILFSISIAEYPNKNGWSFGNR
jgi:hypothetical protein